MQHSHTHTTHRTLLLLAATTAGIGFALAHSDDAHASDRDHTGLVDGVTSIVADTPTPTLPPTAAKPVPPAATAKPVPPAATAKPTKPRRTHTPPKPRPVRHLVHHTTGAVKKTATDIADTATRDLPVDTATDLTGRLIDTATTLPNQLLPPPPAAVTPPALTPPTGQQPASGTQPAPEPTIGGAPTPPTVGSGAATPGQLAGRNWQHPTAATGHASTRRLTADNTPASTIRPAAPRRHHLDTDPDGGAHPEAVTTHHLDGTVGDRWTHHTTIGQNPTGHHRDHTGRAWPPTPPSG